MSRLSELMEEQRQRQMTHFDSYSNSLNPNDAFNNTSEAWAHGVYNAIPNLVDFVQDIGEYTTGRDQTNRAGNALRDLTGASDLGYEPQQLWEKLVSLGGEAVADPATVLGLPYSAYKAFKFAPTGLDNLMRSTPDGRFGQGGMIGGPKAKTADIEALARAQSMKADGVDSDAIYADTGWWLDHPDGVPRFEIDDSGAKFRDVDTRIQWGVTSPAYESPEARLTDALSLLDEGMSDSKVYKLTGYVDRGNGLEDFYTPSRLDAFSHDELGRHYDLDNTRIEYGFNTGSVGGSYNPLKDDIEINTGTLTDDGISYPQPQTTSNTLHELQHAIQRRENMARGGSLELFTQPQGAAKARVNFLNNELSRIAKEMDEISTGYRQPKPGKEEQLRYLADEYDAAMEEKLNLWDAATADPYQQYKKLAGESEARLVQDRMNMTMDERLANPFFHNYDVPLEDQIIRMDDGLSMSLTKF